MMTYVGYVASLLAFVVDADGRDIEAKPEGCEVCPTMPTGWIPDTLTQLAPWLTFDERNDLPDPLYGRVFHATASSRTVCDHPTGTTITFDVQFHRCYPKPPSTTYMVNDVDGVPDRPSAIRALRQLIRQTETRTATKQVDTLPAVLAAVKAFLCAPIPNRSARQERRYALTMGMVATALVLIALTALNVHGRRR
ncbi:hypothetical protein PBRA_004169 [Plasmodiophora brassicae]|uniref:Uncharacterized protein n=1 Tax=Plasmodiophora brassicae TaxID=37360 RepID=A0A0G4IJR1_PLABS|nr:hypothetical protein PBRA_004169 [Plasmodiophora brassicae]